MNLFHVLKNMIKNPSARFGYLSALGFYDKVPDDEYLKRKYKVIIGRELNLENPQTFNQKLQWLKLYDRRPEYTMMVDKFEVKKYVSDLIGEEYIIPTLGVWNHFDEIDFSKLPDQFVLKCTHDSGGLVICRDKNNLDKVAAKRKIEHCLKRNYYWLGREWPYKHVKPRIIAEQYLEDNTYVFGNNGLTDYKFFCFSGKPKMIYISNGMENHTTAKISFYDMNGNEMPFHRSDYQPIMGKVTLPDNFLSMEKVAKKLAKNINNPFVRIDLYSLQGKVYFSEITFSPCSGMIPFDPMNWDYKLGQWIELPKETLQ